ncbi:MAG: TetR family transcriptional regulator [Proteobacteria bacterium]|nr:TetR family transcriptional regulator [Pseudomonadota bacterium]
MTVHSSKSSSTRSSGKDKRERILDAAERIFARNGFYNARVAEIARAAGVADGTIYLYFKSKDDLLISLFESRMERVTGELTRAVAAAQGPRDRLLAIIRTHFQMVHDNPLVAEVLTIELRQSSKFMKEYSNPQFGEFLKLIASVIGEGQEAGEFDRGVPAPHAARMIFGIIDELALAWLLGGGENFDIVRAADWVGAFVMNGLHSRVTEDSGASGINPPLPGIEQLQE